MYICELVSRGEVTGKGEVGIKKGILYRKILKTYIMY